MAHALQFKSGAWSLQLPSNSNRNQGVHSNLRFLFQLVMTTPWLSRWTFHRIPAAFLQLAGSLTP